jgi:hypothetical protein
MNDQTATTGSSPQNTLPKPIFSGKCNVIHFQTCNPRKMVDSQVDHLAEQMKITVKDMQHPVFACVPSFNIARARFALEQQQPYPCKIIVRLF